VALRIRGIINAQLQQRLTELRHTDLFAISDSGLPVPPHVPVVDLALCYCIPGFIQTLHLILNEVTVQAAWSSQEVIQSNPVVNSRLKSLPNLQLIDHSGLKLRVSDCSFVVRTGEATPFANVILEAGVPWFGG
jgi:D-ribose pyranase